MPCQLNIHMKNNKGYYNWIHTLNHAALDVQKNHAKLLRESGEEGLKQGRTRMFGHSRPSMTLSDDGKGNEDPIFATARALGELIRKVNEGPGGPESKPLVKGLQIPMDVETSRKLLQIAKGIHANPETPLGGEDLGYEELDRSAPETTRSIGKPAGPEELEMFRQARQQKIGQVEPQPEPDLAPPGDMDGDGDSDATDVQTELDRDYSDMMAQISGNESKFKHTSVEGNFSFPESHTESNAFAQNLIDQHTDIVRSGNRGALDRMHEVMQQFMQHARDRGHHNAADAVKGHMGRFILGAAQAARENRVSPYEVPDSMSMQEQRQHYLNTKIRNMFTR